MSTLATINKCSTCLSMIKRLSSFTLKYDALSSEDAKMDVCDVYGAEHLLRLFGTSRCSRWLYFFFKKSRSFGFTFLWLASAAHTPPCYSHCVAFAFLRSSICITVMQLG